MDHEGRLTLKIGSRCLCCVMERLLVGLYTTQLPAPSTTPLRSTFKVDSLCSPTQAYKAAVVANNRGVIPATAGSWPKLPGFWNLMPPDGCIAKQRADLAT